MAVDSNKPIAFTFAGLPQPYCFSTPERFALDLVASLYGYIPGQYSVIIDSESEPPVADRGKLWFKREVGGAPTGILYAYFNGNWVSPNREAAGSLARRIFRGTPAQAWAYDGGDGTDPAVNPPTSASGAMWEIDTNFAARMPLGVGTLQPSATVVALGDTGGADEHVQTEAQLAAHVHPPLSPSIQFFTQRPSGNNTGLGGTPLAYGEPTTGSTGSSEAMPTVSPYLGVYFIKRTARVYYVA